MVFTRLFEEYHIGNLRLRNRMIMPPCTTSFAQDGYVTEKMKHHYVVRARGGVGMMVVEDGIVDSSIGRHDPNDLWVDDDKYIPGLRGLATAIKDQGAIAAIQINHGGRRNGKVVNGSLILTNGKIPVAPSSIAHWEPGFVVPRELAGWEIEEIVEKYAQAARRVREAGFEAVSVHCSHAYLVNQFLSPAFNKRQDEWGGDFERRLRFILSIVAAVRQHVGADYPIFCRISGEEPFEGGLSLAEMQRVAQRLEQAGVKAFILSRGASTAPALTSNFIASVAPMRVPRGCLVYLSEGIKQAVTVPVGVGNRINDPVLAERVLEEGKADLISMGRALIADPELPNKAREGRLNEIRTCIACTACLDRVTFDSPKLVCSINAEVGRDDYEGDRSATARKRVLVIGGGPAGMEAARAAATRGHEVHVCEREPQLGGQLLIAAVPPGKSEIGELTRYLTSELSRLGVQVNVSTPVTRDVIDRLNPDLIIAATGANQAVPPIPGVDMDHVVMAVDVLRGAKTVIGKVVILGGGQVGAEVAEHLAVTGSDVTILTSLNQIAAEAPSAERRLLMLSLAEHGVKTIIRTNVEGITRSGVIARNRAGEEMLIPADSVVLAKGATPAREVGQLLAGYRVLWVGDCVAARTIFDAIHEGYDAALQV